MQYYWITFYYKEEWGVGYWKPDPKEREISAPIKK